MSATRRYPSRSLLLGVTAGDGSHVEQAINVHVAPGNDAPVLADLAPSATFQEGAAPALLDAEVTFADVEGNVGGGTLTLSGLLTEDRVGIRNQGSGQDEIGVSGNAISYEGILIGTVAGGVGGTLTVTLNAAANVEAVDALIQNLTYFNVSNIPTASRQLVLNVTRCRRRRSRSAAGAGELRPADRRRQSVPEPRYAPRAHSGPDRPGPRRRPGRRCGRARRRAAGLSKRRPWHLRRAGGRRQPVQRRGRGQLLGTGLHRPGRRRRHRRGDRQHFRRAPFIPQQWRRQLHRADRHSQSVRRGAGEWLCDAGLRRRG